MTRKRIPKVTVDGVEHHLVDENWKQQTRRVCTQQGVHCLEGIVQGSYSCAKCKDQPVMSFNARLIADKVVEEAGAFGLAGAALHAGAALGADMLYQAQYGGTHGRRKT